MRAGGALELALDHVLFSPLSPDSSILVLEYLLTIPDCS